MHGTMININEFRNNKQKQEFKAKFCQQGAVVTNQKVAQFYSQRQRKDDTLIERGVIESHIEKINPCMRTTLMSW